MKFSSFTRKIVITNAVYNSGNWTLTTSAPHLLVVGDVVPLYDRSADVQATVNATCIAGTTGSTIVITYAVPLATFVPDVYLTSFPTGFTGFSETVNLSSNLTCVQATTTTTAGNGSHGATLQVSNDGIGWITQGTFSATAAASPNSDALNFNIPWAYARINITSLTGTNGKTYFTSAGERL